MRSERAIKVKKRNIQFNIVTNSVMKDHQLINNLLNLTEIN